MKNAHHLLNEYDWILRVFAVEKTRGILKTSDEALCYEMLLFDYHKQMLTDEQKIACILAGGVSSLSEQQQMRMGSDPQTGQLPVLC